MVLKNIALAALISLISTSAFAQSAKPAAKKPAVVYHQFVVTRVKDGDTFVIDTNAYRFLPELEFSVRVYGIDTPEKGAAAKCPREAALAVQASAYGKQLIAETNNLVLLSRVKHDKYGGRFDATVTLSDGSDYAQRMIAKGLAYPYFGGTKQSWCQ